MAWPPVSASLPWPGRFKAERCSDSFFCFLALARSPRRGLLDTGPQGLLDRRTSVESPSVLHRSEFDGHQAPTVCGVLGIPQPFHQTLVITRKIQPHEYLEGWLVVKASPGLGDHHPPDSGMVPAGWHSGRGLAADPGEATAPIRARAAAGGPGPGGTSLLGQAWQCGHGCAQAAAHDLSAAGSGPLRWKFGFCRFPKSVVVKHAELGGSLASGTRTACGVTRGGPLGTGSCPCGARAPWMWQLCGAFPAAEGGVGGRTSHFPALVPGAWLQQRGQEGLASVCDIAREKMEQFLSGPENYRKSTQWPCLYCENEHNTP